ncbi:hypothetical protein M0805_004097 [Coniferiporia weirii]|nr:hypothetical protein M0805_004097 [Coniferiporia weirii]
MSTTTQSESPAGPSNTGAEISTALISSTPSKARVFSQNYTWNGVGSELEQDVENYTCSDIDFPTFIKLAFDLDDKGYADRIKEIQSWAIHDKQEYKNALTRFVKAGAESAMYGPFEEMGNIILKRAADEHNIVNKVKLLVVKEHIVRDGHGSRKPDVLLVPEDVMPHSTEKKANTAKEGVVDGQSSSAKGKMPQTTISYRQILMPFEFKLERNAPGKSQASSTGPESGEGSNSSKKRKRSAADGGGGASKRQSNSSIKSTEIGGSGSGTRPSEEINQGEARSHRSSTKQTRSLLHDPDTKDLFSPPGDTVAPAERPIVSTGLPRANRGTQSRRSGSGRGRPSTKPKRSLGAQAAVRASTPASTYPRSVNVQLAGYIAELFSVRGDRSFVFGARVIGSSITVCFYHRSAIIEADAFDLAENPEYFAILLTMFHRDLPTLGFNKYMGYCNPFNVDDASTMKLGVRLTPFGKDGSPDEIDLNTIKLGEKVASPYCLIGRGTSVIVATVSGYQNELVVKFSWQVATRRGEEEFILKAREVDPVHVPEIFGKAVIVDNTPIAKLRAACGKKKNKVTDSEYEVRELRILVMRKYTPIYELLNDQLWDVIVQLATCVHKLYAEIGLLHRDISITNLAFYVVNNKVIGVLIDFDLASLPPYTRASKHRTGTAPFMAREVLNKRDYCHGVHHELESFLYIAVWHGAGYKGYTLQPGRHDVLKEWRKSNWEKVLEAKKLFITDDDKAERIFAGINDQKLSWRCRFIRQEFWVANYERDGATLTQRLQNLEAYRRKMSEDPELKGPPVNQPVFVPERPVSFAEWMRGAGENPDETVQCNCCVGKAT